MLTKENILSYFDNIYSLGTYWSFPVLGDVYSFLIDCRLNVFKHFDEWAVIVERLGYSQKGGCIELQLIHMGNCLKNLPLCNEEATNTHFVWPVEQQSFENSTTGFSLNKKGDCWIINQKSIMLPFDKSCYSAKGITLKEYEPDEVAVEEAARYLIIDNQDDFRAKDEQLYQSIPSDLKKILVLDEWHHKDYTQMDNNEFSDNETRRIFDFNKSLNGLAGLDIDALKVLMNSQISRNTESDRLNFQNCRPGTYETWDQLSEVIITGNINFYQPTLSPNTHWKNWPESGSL